MMTKLLEVLNEGRAYSQTDIANLTGSSEESILAQIEFLEIQGYLKRVNFASCGGKTCIGCKGCAGRIKPPLMWELTNDKKKL